MAALDPKITKAYIREMVTTDNGWACRAILALYDRQTSDEKAVQITKENNAKGFSGPDATFMSSLAERLLSGRALTQRQLEVVKPKLGKYAGQLLLVAQANAEAKAKAEAEAEEE